MVDWPEDVEAAWKEAIIGPLFDDRKSDPRVVRFMQQVFAKGIQYACGRIVHVIVVADKDQPLTQVEDVLKTAEILTDQSAMFAAAGAAKNHVSPDAP